MSELSRETLEYCRSLLINLIDVTSIEASTVEFNGIMKLALQALTEVMDSADIIAESGGLVKNSELVMSYIWKILSSICENQ